MTEPPEATSLIAESNEQSSLAALPFKLQKLPHLTDYIPNLKTIPNPLDQNSFFRLSEGFYINPGEAILRQIILEPCESRAFPSI